MRLVAALFCAFSLMLMLPQGARAQEDDVGFLTRLLQDSLSDAGREVRITGFRGALSSRATITEMTIADDAGVWLTLRDAAMSWNRSALLARRIEIAEISAREMIIERAPATDDAGLPAPEARAEPRQPFSLPELPVAVELRQLAVERIVLGASLLGEDVALTASGNLSLADGDGQAVLQVARIDGSEGQLDLRAAFSNRTRDLSLALDLSEGPDGIAATLLGIPDRPSTTLRINGAGPLDDFTAEVAIGTDGEDRITGAVRVEAPGPDAPQVFDLDLAGDLQPLLNPDFHGFFGARSMLRAKAQRLPEGGVRLDELLVETELLRLRGQAAVRADGVPEVIDLRGRILSPDGGPVVLPLPGPRTTVEDARLEVAFDSAQDEDWGLGFELRELRRPDLSVALLKASGIGRIRPAASGGAEVIDAVLDFRADGIAPQDPALAEAIGSRVDGNLGMIWRAGAPLQVPALLIEGADYWLLGEAAYDAGTLVLDAEAELGQIARFSGLAGRQLSGALTGRVSGELLPLTGGFDLEARMTGQNVTVDIDEVDRLLSGHSEIVLSTRRGTDGIELRSFSARAQTLDARFSGMIRSDALALDGTLRFSDLSVLGAQYGGALDARVGLSGRSGQERLELFATGRDLAMGQADLDRAMRGETALELVARRDRETLLIDQAVLRNPALSAELAGRLAADASELEASFRIPALSAIRPQFSGAVTGTARLAETGSLRRAEIDLTGNNLRVGQPQADLLLAGTTRLEARAGTRDGALFIESADLTSPQLAARVRGAATPQAPLQITARLNDLALLARGLSGPVELAGSARDTGTGFALELDANGPGGIAARIQGQIDRDLRAALAITGGTDLSLISPFIAPASIQGPAQFDLRIDGPLSLGSVSGTATAAGVTFVQPAVHLRLSDIAARAELRSGRAEVDVRGAGARGGRFAITGSAELGGAQRLDMTLTLDDLVVSDPQLFQTSVSGRAAFTGALTGERLVSGALQLGAAEIRIPGTGLGGPGYVPPGIVHRNESAASRATRERAGITAEDAARIAATVPIRLDLALDAPNRIFIRGRGLDAELGGTLRLTGTTRDVIPIGQFGLIRGRLDLLGNRFTLTEGYASMQGQFVPFVRLVATTESGGVSTSIAVEGEVSAPRITFSSVPELPEEEVVSRLIFNRELASLSAFQAAQLASAIATLSGRGGNGLMERLRTNVGLDDLDITTDEEGNAAIRAGRYVTENIYTDVVLDPQGRSEVTINLDVSPALTLRGRVDAQGRAGVGVFFERDY